MASTGTGSLGRKPVFQLKGEETIPQAIRANSNRKVTSLFSRKYLMVLFSIISRFIVIVTPHRGGDFFEQDKNRGGGGQGFYLIFRKRYRIF